MSDEMNDLIAEAREFLRSENAQYYDSSLIGALADALEAATRERVQGEPNDDREALARVLYIARDDFALPDRMAKAWDAPGPHGRQRWYRYADAVLAAGFSRASVPDAATEEKFKKAEAFDKAVALSERRQTLLEEAEAERDAALAAIERVRVVADDWASDEDAKGLHFDLRAALDGAPEPEWEYQGRTDYGRVVAQGSLDEVGFLSEHLFWERRRPAGEWLPVEGESKP